MRDAPPSPPKDLDASPIEAAEKAKDSKLSDSRSREEAKEDADAEAEPMRRAPAPEAEPAADKSNSDDDVLGLDTPAAETESKAAPAPAPAKKAAESSAKPASSSRGDSLEYDEGPYGGGVGSGYGGRIARRPAPRWKISPAAAPSYDVLAKLEALRQIVLRDPTSRPAHRKLVQNAIRAGAPEAFTYAVAWSQADPDHAPALLAVADLLAARGEAIAMRAYGSAVEVNPFDAKLQTRLAEALASKGDIARSCAHRRAVVSIDPSRAEHHLQLTRCLASLGRTDLVQGAAEEGLARAPGNNADLRAALSGAVRPAALRPVNGQLKATLTWLGAGDLDIAFIDSRGRRLSALRPENLVVEQLGNGESAAMISVSPQTVAVEITRFSGQGPVSGELKLRTPELSRSYPFTIDQGSLRLANVTYSAQRAYGWYD